VHLATQISGASRPLLQAEGDLRTRSGYGFSTKDSLKNSRCDAPTLRQQPAANHEQVCQRASHLHTVEVFRQASIPNLRESEQSFDDPEGVLDARADLRLGPVLETLGLIDLTVVTVASIGSSFAFGTRLRITSPWPRYA
jgi:hypothetical protein